MIHVIPAAKRHFTDFGWLQTHWLFSFADYYDPANIQFGPLRVFNDDIVQPGSGFPTHPHREMEIVTVVLEGEITHRDGMGNVTVIRAGDVQRMSAGTGLTHSEFNLAETPVHFHQIWIFPDRLGQQPSYDQSYFDADQWHNRLVPVASGQGHKGAVTFHTDAAIYRSSLATGHSVEFHGDEARRVFIYLTSGRLQVKGRSLGPGDQARIDLEKRIILTAEEGPAELVLIDLPSCKGWGYDHKTLAGAKAK